MATLLPSSNPSRPLSTPGRLARSTAEAVRRDDATARCSRPSAASSSRCSSRCSPAPSSPTRCRAIVTDLHGSQTGYTWVVVATLLTMTATTPIWGKLADLFSKKLLVQTRAGHLRRRLADRRLRAQHGRADRRPRDPGPRRRRPDRAGPGRDRQRWSPRASAAATPATSARSSPLATVSGPLIGGLIVDTPARLALVLLRRPPGRGRWRSSCCRRRCTCPSSSARCTSTTSAPPCIVGGVSHPAGLGLPGRQPVRLDLRHQLRARRRRPGRPRRRGLRRGEGRRRADHPAAPLPRPHHGARHRRLGADRRRDVRLDGLPQPVLPARPRHEPRPTPA